jgi:cold shock CspA family protein
MSCENNTSTSASTEVMQAKVKWFNSQAGYGFIEMITDDGNTEDLFVHHSALKVSSDMFRYLVEGEYVEYSTKIIKRSGEDKLTAYAVTGIGKGPLQCETRHCRRLTESSRSSGGGRDREEGSPNGSRLWEVVKEQLSGDQLCDQ